MRSSVRSTQDASLLIFYDWQENLDSQAWSELGFRFFERIGAEPNSAGYLREDGKYRTIKPKNFPLTLKKYAIKGASLTALRPPFNDLNSYTATCEFSGHAMERKRTAFFCYNSVFLDFDLLAGLTHDFIKLVGPVYGIALQFPLSKGPGYFALDMLFVSVEDRNTIAHRRERELMQIWTTERLDYQDRPPAPFRHLDGMQRDVFPYNILTDKHLVRKVNGLSLREWILSSPERGFLKEISTGCWVWVVPSAELMKIRETLQMNDLLIVHPKSS